MTLNDQCFKIQAYFGAHHETLNNNCDIAWSPCDSTAFLFIIQPPTR